MMYIWRLTNKVTFSRAVVTAESAEAAKRIHPTNDLAAWDELAGRWQRWRDGGLGKFTGYQHVPAPRGWTTNLDLIDAEILGEVTDRSPAIACEAYQASEELRAPGEGPDETWGGRGLRELGGDYGSYAVEDFGPLFSSVLDE